MRRSLAGALTALLLAAALAGCGGGSDGADGGSLLRGVYTLNGGGGFNVDGTVSFINTAQSNTVTVRAFDAGKVPNFMVIRGNQGYIVNSVSNNVQIVDLATGGLVGVVGTGDGSNPMKLALGPDGRAYVTNLFTNSVAVVDLVNRTLVQTIDVSAAGAGPTGITIANGKLYVTLTNFNLADFSYGPGKVAVIPLSTLQVATTIGVGTNPQDAIVGPDLRVHVSATGNYADVPGQADIINPANDTVAATVALGGTPASLTAATGNRVFVADGSRGVLAYDAVSGQILFGGGNAIAATQVATEQTSVFDVKFDPQTGLVYAADFPKDRVFAIDPATGAITATIGVGDGPAALGVYPQ